MLAQGMDEVITLVKLKRLQTQAMQANHLEELEIEGLTLERALVFPSGLSILIAIFELLGIESMTLAGGALREGLVYEMITELRQDNIRERTIKSIQSRYQIDAIYAREVLTLPAICYSNAVVQNGYRNLSPECCFEPLLNYMKSACRLILKPAVSITPT